MNDSHWLALRDELPLHDEPELGTLVADSLRQGRRMRRNRRLYQAGTVAATCALLAGALGVHSQWGGPESARRPPVVQVAAQASKSPSPTSSMTTATPEALLELLIEVLPPGRTGHYAKLSQAMASDPKLYVQTYLDRGRGPGMIRLSVTTKKQADAYSRLLKESGYAVKSWRLPDGNQVTTLENPTVCQQARTIQVERADGSVARLDLASCLVWKSSLDPGGRLALSQAEAIRIASDPRIGTRMPSDLVHRGAKRFPNLPWMS